MITRIQLMKVHAVLAAFTLPVAIMFMVTGALYTWGIKGSYTNEVYEVPLTEILTPELTTLTSLVVKELDQRDISLPEGKAKVKKIGSAFMLEWTGSTKDISLEPTGRDLVAKLTVKETSWYRNLVQLHKAKGGVVFKVYAAFFAFVLGMLLISGFMMAWQTPKLKRITSFFIDGIPVIKPSTYQSERACSSAKR